MSNDEIKPSKQNVVVNVNIYDSETESEEDDYEFPDFGKRVRLDSVDEDTEEICNILNNLLEEIGEVEPTGKKNITLEFFEPKNIDFLKKNENCDFDTNELGYPYLPSGSECFIVPFFETLKKKNKQFSGLKIITNSKGFTFKT